MEGRAFAGHFVDDRLGNVGQQPLLQLGAHQAVRGVGSHAAGVGASVSLADALVVLRGGQRYGVFAVAESEERQLFAVKELFEDKLFFGGAEQCAGEYLRGGFFGLGVGVAEDYALASGESVSLDDDRCTEAREFATEVFERAADGVGGGGNRVALHELLGEGFAGLQARGGLRGAEDAQAAAFELIDQAKREWKFGANDGEGWVFRLDYT